MGGNYQNCYWVSCGAFDQSEQAHSYFFSKPISTVFSIRFIKKSIEQMDQSEALKSN